MKTWYERNATVLKVALCGFLLLILLIPATMIRSMISERSQRAEEAKTEILSKWGASQAFTGPIISVPYVNDKKEIVYYHILPEKLMIDSKLSPEIRKRGIYETVVYTSGNTIRADFSRLSDMLPKGIGFDWNKAVVSFGISDMRGINEGLKGTIRLGAAPKPIEWQPGLVTDDVISTGIHANPVLSPDMNPSIEMSLSLRGGESVRFLPLGKTTDVTVSSAWESPSFDGAFLPLEKTLTKDGFSARWQVLHFNRDFPQSWEGSAYQLMYIPETVVYAFDEPAYDEKLSYSPSGRGSGNNIGTNAFGVKLIQTVDHYDKSDRAAKYAILIIGLSFLTFFLLEVGYKRRVHAIQYLLIGFTLVVFYTLLLAFAEHIGFNASYILASVGTIALIGLYTRSIWDSSKFALYMSGILAFLYGLIFVILQSEDYALLIGSISIFIILSLVMYLTRKIDWYTQG